MDSEDIYENVMDSTGPQTQNHNQDKGKYKKCKGSRCMLVLLVFLGFICALLLLVITLQHISITAERDLFKTYKNTVEELNHTISSLQHDNTDLESTVTSLSDKLKQAYLKQGWLFMSTEAMSWSESRQFCRDRGADLVIIRSEEKQRFISSLVKEDTWIGLSDTKIEGTMQWVDNSTLDQGFWARGEPNNYLSLNEDCVEVRISQGIPNNWNDLPCSNRRKGICEK